MTNSEKLGLISAYCKVYYGRRRQFISQLSDYSKTPDEIRIIAQKIEAAESEAVENICKIIESSNEEE